MITVLSAANTRTIAPANVPACALAASCSFVRNLQASHASHISHRLRRSNAGNWRPLRSLMGKPKIFISHASEDTRVAGRLAECLSADFDVVIDASRLHAGDVWAEEIWSWMLDCDAAIVLLSTQAERSPWVPAEAFLLSGRRQRLDSRLRLIPVLLDGYSLDRPEARPFAPAELHRLQALKVGSDATEFSPIRDALAPVLVEQSLGIPREVVRALASQLNKAGREAIEAVREGLKMEPSELELVRDKAAWLACHLVRQDLDSMALVASKLAAVTRGCAQEMLDIVFPYCWVDEQAAGQLRAHVAAPPPRRTVALNARHEDTPAMYVRRASGRTKGWPMVKCAAAWGHVNTATEVVEHIRARIAYLLGMGKGDEPEFDDLDDELTKFLERQQAMVVIFPPEFADLDARLLTEIEAAFGKLVLLLRSEKPLGALSSKLQGIVLLPDLEKSTEARAYRMRRQAQRDIEAFGCIKEV